MRITTVICLCLICCDFAHGQAPSDPEQIIRREVDTGFFDAHDQNVLDHMGDSAAVLVTKILAGQELTQKTILSVLEVLSESFADPSFVETEADRQPRTAMLVLRYLDLSTTDAATKKHIAETGRYLQDRYAKSLQHVRQ